MHYHYYLGAIAIIVLINIIILRKHKMCHRHKKIFPAAVFNVISQLRTLTRNAINCTLNNFTFAHFLVQKP